MKNKIIDKLTNKLSFKFGILFAILAVVIPTAAGIYIYFGLFSEYIGNAEDMITHISRLLKSETDGIIMGDNYEDWQQKAEQMTNAFDLPYVTLCEVSDDNQLLHLASAIHTSEVQDEDLNSISSDFKDVSPEFAEVLSEVRDNGFTVSFNDIYNGKYGKTVVCYTTMELSGGKFGTMCVAADISEADNKALLGALFFALVLEVIIVAFFLFGMRSIRKHCTGRLNYLSQSIEEYTRTKDPSIADQIRQSTLENDEIAVLSLHAASMMTEMQAHIYRIMRISGELLTANEQAEKFSELARKDALTGLENKLSYYENVKRLDEMILGEKAQLDFAIIVFDLNFLKRINDEYGHSEGDVVLKKLADKIKAFFGENRSYRIGGDEFTVIIEGEESKNALTLAANFRSLLDSENASGQRISEPSAAIGCSNYRAGQDKCVKDVFERADNEMYGNKIQMKAVRKD